MSTTHAILTVLQDRAGQVKSGERQTFPSLRKDFSERELANALTQILGFEIEEFANEEVCGQMDMMSNRPSKAEYDTLLTENLELERKLNQIRRLVGE